MATQQQAHQQQQQPPPLQPPQSNNAVPNTAATARTSSYTALPPPAAYTPLRYASNRKTIYDRNLNRARTSELSLASFAHLFNTLIAYHQARAPSVSDLEARLAESAYPIGVKLLDLLLFRMPPRTASRPTRLLDLLQFIHTTLWRSLFGRPADALEASTGNNNDYMIIDNDPLVNTYISIPKEMSQLNCAAFVGGIIEGICDAAGFSTDGVTAHWAENDELWPSKTIFLVKFKPEVVEREEALKAGGG
ncbi:trafficking protein particle complex subunit 5 [Aureobasidium pullulans]|uniref:Trafficking protein particle complex subunit n=1 Tax=Aureobasidium pullulans TaxID=5580 RepID=A0A4S9IV56_AURPU|nr:trafficking protein particle complex subunit 5 [Aureobasidium pullulans]THX07614.1 trafficking protein particle complex subunit 5 [Aureobasidium pullulans]THX91689.1 trafficking protein particle complex subunit 5 [Aureobasidium pullulans]TIA67475.1 trafficking protein particle complex subunit 5 [Aureobasidium pullulans]